MKRGLLWLLLCMALGTLPARAQSCEVMSHPFPRCYFYRRHKPAEPWQPLNDTPAPAVRVDYRAGQDNTWYFRAFGEDGWFFAYDGETEQPVLISVRTATVSVTRQLRTGRVLVVVLTPLLGLAAGAAWQWRRRYHGARDEAAQAHAQADEARRSLLEQMPRTIGSYRVTGRLGSGGMAAVYAALDSEGHAVAVKVPLFLLIENEESRRRFVREMQLGAQLRHPNIVRIEAVSMPDEYPPYIVMELLEGQTLDTHLGTPLPLPEVLDLGHHLLDAIEYIHSRRIIHRDIKPSNIILTARGPKLMDFGIARAGDLTALTGADQMLGTPFYMAPEQIRGLTDERSDLFGVGMVLYECLAGLLPHSGDAMETLTRRLTEDMPSLATVRPDLPEPVITWVDKLVASSPDDRFASAAAAQEMLRRLRSG